MSALLERLLAASKKPERTVVGLMSGTSADAIDVAVCVIGGTPERVKLLHYGEIPHEADLKSRIVRPTEMAVRAIAELNVGIGEAFASACRKVVGEAGLSMADVDLVGSHGQTVYHHSSIAAAVKSTLQLGDGDVIAERLGVPVISDFRARDLAAGGEGAPLSPRADVVLFRPSDAKTRRRAVLNLGGIGNLTILDDDPSRVFGFDTGPANSLLDRAARRITGGSLAFDEDGKLARSGRVNEELVAFLLESDAFLLKPPPKSTGFEMYGDDFVDRAAERHGGVDADLLASLTEFTARTVAIAFERFVKVEPAVDEVVAAGGGFRNPALMERIAYHLKPIRVRPSDELGVPADAREAMAFAILADLTWRGESASLPGVTGASRGTPLGKLSFPPIGRGS